MFNLTNNNKYIYICENYTKNSDQKKINFIRRKCKLRCRLILKA